VSYGPDVTRDFVTRYGSVRAAEAIARSVPGFAEEIGKVEKQLAAMATHAFERTRPAFDADERAWRREVGFAPPEIVAAELARLQARRADLIVAALSAEEGAPGARDQLEQVIALLARPQQPPKGKRGPKLQDPPAKTKRRVAELRIAGEGVAEIRRDTGLSKWIATRLVRDVDDALGALRAGRY
jgi:hypothetical protein